MHLFFSKFSSTFIYTFYFIHSRAKVYYAKLSAKVYKYNNIRFQGKRDEKLNAYY